MPEALIVGAVLACAGCAPDPPPPAAVYFAGLPVSGDLSTARRAGFGSCFNDTAATLSCRRHSVTLLGEGPFEASVDLRGRSGQSGFHALTVWHAHDQRAVFAILPQLVRRGWSYCYTGSERVGDQAIFRRQGEAVSVAVDISYYGNRRLRILPSAVLARLTGKCTPGTGLGRFGIRAF